MKRMSFALFAAFAVAAGFALAPSSLSAAPAGQTSSDGIEELEKTLAEVLRARRPEEFAFLELVIDRVEDGTLPRSLVVSTFNWARKKPRHPFQYFEQGLRVRAKKIGVVL